jgi:hypothetical protein
LIETLQIVGIFKRQVALGWPDVLQQLMSSVSFLQFDFTTSSVRVSAVSAPLMC